MLLAWRPEGVEVVVVGWSLGVSCMVSEGLRQVGK